MEQPERLVVVSNRLPVSLRRSAEGWRSEHSAGGLATAMKPLLARTNGIWVGWPGDSSDPEDPQRQEVLRRWAEQDGYFVVELPADIAEAYYEGFANQTLWPLFHHLPSRVVFNPGGWKAYQEANRRFCDAVVERHRPGDLIWVHDYQLMLLPQMLREALPDAQIGFFLHIPLPSSEVFRILPHREELLLGLLGADLLAFQTHSHLQHFRNALMRILGMESGIDKVDTSGRAIRLEALPIGIAPEEFAGKINSAETARYRAELQRRYQGKRILLAVDRLDYTKGIPERLRTFRRLLARAPHLRGQVVLIQVAVPSRGNIATYAELRRRVNELVGEINGQFGTPDWTPLVYIRRDIPRAQLVALYSAADVGWIAPLRDGMNLVAKEFVACKGDGEGVLVLSEFAGAAAEMGEAFLVNPFDEDSTAAAVERALSLLPDERRQRMAPLHDRVVRNNVFGWSERFLSKLRESIAERTRRQAEQPAPINLTEILAAYRAAHKRLLFLDYDGTLAPYARRPEQALPSPDILQLLHRLASDPANHVTLISGRRRNDLERWFGAIQPMWLAAEHGAVMRPANSSGWEPLRSNGPADWKSTVRPILDHFVDRTPGSLIEEKDYSLVWHYRMADPEFGEWLANELTSMLEGMLAETDLRAVRGRKIIEVKPLWISKGEIVARLLSLYPDSDFRFAAGDDRTDEDTFARLDDEAWTIRVGGGQSRARFSLPSVPAAVYMLGRFAEISEQRVARAAERPFGA